ncbi:RecB family exonuclease [Spongisporangium articulatum]|uniref:RecB family exonuclease n=1 Tax=Spongisporangium articulatum TaxID=3362603 RepID=A0ABW8AS65_9ACTN
MNEQFELPGMPARLYPCTPTRLTTWRACPRRYRFTYLDRPPPPKGPPWAHNSVGAAVHSALADWWQLAPARRRDPALPERLVRRRWLTEGFRDELQAVRAADRAVHWVRDYLATQAPDDVPAGVERTVSARTASLVLSGRADRIDARLRVSPDGAGDRAELVIVDYKTGRWVPDEADAAASLALATYAVAAERTLRRPCVRVELHHLPTNSVAAHEHTPASLATAVAEAEALAAGASSADEAHARGRDGDDVFPPSPGDQCSWCDFRRHCPEGRSAAPDRDPWSGLASLCMITNGPRPRPGPG